MNERCEINDLVSYALSADLIEHDDAVWAANRLLEVMEMPGSQCLEQVVEGPVSSEPASPGWLESILSRLLDDAVSRKLIADNRAERDLFDTKLMGELTPRPSIVIAKFREKYQHLPSCATDWFYKFNIDCGYIRKYRTEKDIKWSVPTSFGELDITINLSKPEKDPKDIAEAANVRDQGYPECQLCRGNEGYPGRLDHPARQNLRLIPITLDDEQWYFQYSPYDYFNEHCIVLNGRHVPMRIDASTFRKLFEFLELFPAYTIGSNADLPIVGGSILSHDHFQGGRFDFPLMRAVGREEVIFAGFEDVDASIVDWPMSVLRLKGADVDRLTALAEKVLGAWRGYSDETIGVVAETDGVPHNTVTPIARRCPGCDGNGQIYQLDLILRCNITTPDHPLGLFHPHEELHHIKKENIGLIEAMGLAILPGRLKGELRDLAIALIDEKDVSGISSIAKHAVWAEELKSRHGSLLSECDASDLTCVEKVEDMLKREVGAVFEKVLEQAGVFKRDAEGKAAFSRFIGHVNEL